MRGSWSGLPVISLASFPIRAGPLVPISKPLQLFWGAALDKVLKRQLTNNSQPLDGLKAQGRVSHGCCRPQHLPDSGAPSFSASEAQLCQLFLGPWQRCSDLFSCPPPFLSIPKDNCLALPGYLKENMDKFLLGASLTPEPTHTTRKASFKVFSLMSLFLPLISLTSVETCPQIHDHSFPPTT